VRKIIKIFIDLDGTICGYNGCVSYLINTKGLFRTGLLSEHLPPNRSWSILTARPKIDRFIINRALRKYLLFPEEVIVSPTWFYKFNNTESVANWKSSVLSKVADSMFVDKVIYIDSDSDMLSRIINHNNIILCKPETINNVLEELEEKDINA